MRILLLRLTALAVGVSLLTGCFPRQTPIEPRVAFVPKTYDLKEKPSPFPALLPNEKQTDWGVEYRVGVGFARELDLYRAVTSFKRALFLLPRREKERRLELNYNIALAYYLGGKYQEATQAVEESPLLHVGTDFVAYEEVMILLYDSYNRLGECDKAAAALQRLQGVSPDTAKLAQCGAAIWQADFATLQECSCTVPEVQELIDRYCRCRKSVCKAQWLSAALPGAGFWYVGQKQSALTSFLLNALFIAAAYQFFDRGYYALGGFMVSLEAGWYFGGIYGAGEAAHMYNERLYERMAQPLMDKKRLHAPMLFRWSF